MYLNCKISVPDIKGKITVKRVKNIPYVYFEYGRVYNREKKYNTPKRACIGKLLEDDEMMIPNTNFLRYFPDVTLPDEADDNYRCSLLHIGSFIIIHKIIQELSLDTLLTGIMGKDAELFLDLAAYSIVEEDNAAQYYPDYAYDHPLMTEDMKIYSDSKISDFLSENRNDQRITFLNKWNEKRDHRQRIYISYDSTNKACQAGNIELAETGHSKDGQDKPIINYSIGYDHNNREPLFYEAYPGSIVDVSQLQFMLEKTAGYGYRHIGFILDRGYFSKGNIHYMDKKGYSFIIMVKGMKKLVREVVESVQGKFEESRSTSIRAFKVNGITVKRQLYPSDEKERYFHIYYSSKKHVAEREKLEEKIDGMAEHLKSWMGEKVRPAGEYKKYFDLVYYHEGKADEAFMSGIEKTEVIDKEIGYCGYFVLITSEKMSAEEAITLYKSRDASEKLFRGDKSYLGNNAERVYKRESVDTKIFIEFIALIIRNKIYTALKDEMKRNKKKQNFMTVPAALHELEKIEMIKGLDGSYRLDHAVSSTQKTILKAFGLTATDIRKKARELSSELLRIDEEAKEKRDAKNKT